MTPEVMVITPLDRSIVAALQISPRASWRTIATVLDESERTVARRGAALLDSKLVTVCGLPSPSRTKGADNYLAKLRCTPGAASVAAASLARRPETGFCYMLTGLADCVADFSCQSRRIADFIVSDLGSLSGITSVSTYPVLRYFRSLHHWRSDELNAGQMEHLYADAGPFIDAPGVAQLSRTDEIMLAALSINGRTSFDELGRLAGVSIQTARRRFEQMRSEGTFWLRAVFEPRLLGMQVQVTLWVRAPYHVMDKIGEELIKTPQVRNAAVIAGDYQLMVDLVLPAMETLYSYLNSESWMSLTDSVEPALIVDVFKRSNLLTQRMRDLPV